MSASTPPPVGPRPAAGAKALLRAAGQAAAFRKIAQAQLTGPEPAGPASVR